MARDVPELLGWRWIQRWLVLQMLLEEPQHQLLGLRPPLQMRGRPDVEGGLTSGVPAAMPKVEQAHQMRIPPSTDQQHRPLKPARRGAMHRPLLVLAWVALQPMPGHAIGVMALQQIWPIP